MIIIKNKPIAPLNPKRSHPIIPKTIAPFNPKRDDRTPHHQTIAPLNPPSNKKNDHPHFESRRAIEQV